MHVICHYSQFRFIRPKYMFKKWSKLKIICVKLHSKAKCSMEIYTTVYRTSKDLHCRFYSACCPDPWQIGPGFPHLVAAATQMVRVSLLCH